jgi:hypothetical protein
MLQRLYRCGSAFSLSDDRLACRLSKSSPPMVSACSKTRAAVVRARDLAGVAVERCDFFPPVLALLGRQVQEGLC